MPSSPIPDMMRPLFEVRRYRGVVSAHAHDHHQVVLPLSGRLDMVVGELRGTVTANELALIPARTFHRFRGSKGNAFLVIDVPTSEWVADEALGPGFWERIRGQPFVCGGDELGSFASYLATATRGGELRGDNLSHACALLLGIISAQLGLDGESALPASLRAIRGYVDTHLEWPLTVSDLAKVGNVSTSRLHALFRARLATSPRNYVTRTRLHRGAQLLERTDLPIAAIAQRVGYGDQAAFSRAFRRHHGRSPGQHRAARKQEPQVDRHETR